MLCKSQTANVVGCRFHPFQPQQQRVGKLDFSQVLWVIQQEHHFFLAGKATTLRLSTFKFKQNYNTEKFCHKWLWTIYLCGPSFCFSKQKPITVGWCHYANVLNLSQSVFFVRNLDALFRILSDPCRLFFPFSSPSFFPHKEPALRLWF